MPADAVPKAASLTRKGCRWFVNVAIETSSVIEHHTGTGGAVGIDAGLNSLAATSDGIKFHNAEAGKRRKEAMRRAQRALSRCRRGSNRRAKVRARLARLYEHVANARSTHLHKLAAFTARTWSTIVVEDLSIRNMVRSASGTVDEPGTGVAAKRGLSRAIHDAGMGRFIQLLTYKAERSGGRLVRVNARHTSQDCSGAACACGRR